MLLLRELYYQICSIDSTIVQKKIFFCNMDLAIIRIYAPFVKYVLYHMYLFQKKIVL